MGMSYSHLNDRFNFGGYSELAKEFDLTKPLTKRQLASAAAKPGFDLIGVRSPYVILARGMLQETFKLTVTNPKTGESRPMDWDDQLPSDLGARFKEWLKDLPGLDDIYLPRHIPMNSSSTIEIFVDALSP